MKFNTFWSRSINKNLYLYLLYTIWQKKSESSFLQKVEKKHDLQETSYLSHPKILIRKPFGAQKPPDSSEISIRSNFLKPHISKLY